jgi:hypothetical protein
LHLSRQLKGDRIATPTVEGAHERHSVIEREAMMARPQNQAGHSKPQQSQASGSHICERVISFAAAADP